MRILISLLLLANAGSAADRNLFDAPDPTPQFKEIQATSLYLPMSDGVRIAIDVLIPKDLPPDKRIPAILKITRYGRAPVDGGFDFFDRFWVMRGFARVLIDERGTGASFGTVRYGKASLGDLREIVDWVAKQPWSNGRVGAIGDSYEGTTAELLAATGHPAVRAVVVRFSDYNYYTDLIRPGGVFNDWFTKRWQYETAAMDKGRAAKRVDGDAGGSLMKQAVAEHKGNPNVYELAKRSQFIDDSLPAMGGSWADLGIGGVSKELQESHVPMLVFASWFDAGTAQGALQRFRAFSNLQRVIIGAFGHGGYATANPFADDDSLPDPTPRHQLLEALRFFDHYLMDTPDEISSVRRLYYFALGEGAWKSTESWPPAGFGTVSYHFRTDHTLGADEGGSLKLGFAPTSTGEQSRWRTQETEGAVDYSRAIGNMRDLPSFITPPLETPTEITGQPIVRLRLRSSQADPSVFAYLTVVDRAGNEKVLTEGQLRLIHRKFNESEQTLHTYTKADALPMVTDQEIDADIRLFPMSAVLAKGDRLRLLLASNDKSIFSGSPQYEATVFTSSQIDLPEKERPDYIAPTVDREEPLSNGTSGAQEQGPATIRYTGLLQGLQRLVVTLHCDAHQSWSGSLLNLDGSGTERTLSNIRYKRGGDISFTFKIRLPASYLSTSYRGHVSLDGRQIRGTISQGGATLPLEFKRVE